MGFAWLQVQKPVPERLVVSELEMAGDSQFVTAAEATDATVAVVSGQQTVRKALPIV